MKQNDNSLISIIIPIYNSEKHIDGIIQDILKQTISNYELLLIDDGSTDGTSSIIRHYSKRYSNIKSISIQHSGVSNARNIGIKKSKGTWLTFIDADDSIKPDYLERLQSFNYDYDFIISGLMKVDRRGGAEVVVLSSDSFICKNKRDILMRIIDLDTNQMLNSPVGKLYKKDIITKANLQFPPYNVSEDTLFNFNYLTMCSSLKTINYCGYLYQISSNPNSLSKRIHSFEQYQHSIDTLYEYRKYYVKRLPSPNRSLYNSYALKNVWEGFFDSLKSLFLYPRKYRVSVYQDLFKISYYKDAMKNANGSKYRKFIAWAFRTESIVFIECCRLIHLIKLKIHQRISSH